MQPQPNPPKPTKISEGAYGCIYKPAVAKNGKIEPTYVNKIQIEKARTKEEPRLGEIIKTIPNHLRYFAPSEQVSDLVVSVIEKREIKKCAVLNKKEETDKIVALKIPYVGEHTLGEQIKLYHKKLPNTTLSHLLGFHNHLAKALQKLQEDKVRIVHHDLKENNIMYSTTLKCPIIIDFGLAFQVDKIETPAEIEKVFFTHYEKYAPWSIEIVCIGTILKTTEWHRKQIHLPTTLNETIEKIFRENPIYQLCREYVGYQRMKQEENRWKKYIQHLSDSYSNTHSNTINGKKAVMALQEYWDTWDMYSVNVMMLKQLHKYYPPNPDEDTRITNYRDTLINQILRVPNKREPSGSPLPPPLLGASEASPLL
jgi:serine/threonine protein kinase